MVRLNDSAAPALSVASEDPARPPGFFRRRLADPIRTQLTQGVSPEQVTRTLAVGTVCSVIPLLGATTALNIVVGLAARMNQPILQALNWILGPVQLLLIPVYLRLGERIWQAPALDFTVAGMIRSFGQQSPAEFLGRFGTAGVHALTAWVITAPLLGGTVYLALRPLVRRFRTGARKGITS